MCGGLLTAAGILGFVRRRRLRMLHARLEREWAQPKIRNRNYDAIADYHRNRLTTGESGKSLDDRTWDDLNLDAIFAAIDRTESSVGQQLLYHRLRSAPVAANVDAFDALTTRMMADAPTRERAQVILARLATRAG